MKENKRNKYGDIQYIETDRAPRTPLALSPKNCWTVKDPSEACTNWLVEEHGCIERYYSGQRFLMSPKAAEVVQPEGTGGSACIIEFTQNNQEFYLMTIDNKAYAQNCQGGSNPGEQPNETIIREVREELAVEVKPEELIEVGEWSFLSSNPLVDGKWPSRTVIFYAHLPFTSVAHLFPHPLSTSAITMTRVSSLNLELDETQYVVAVPKRILSGPLPAKLNIKRAERGYEKNVEIDFGGHHLECLMRMAGLKHGRFATSYLHTFVINKPDTDRK